MDSATYIGIDPFLCVSFVNIRTVTKSAVLQFMAIFYGRSASNLGPAAAKICCGADSAIVVRLDTFHFEFVKDHLQSEAQTEENVQQAMQNRDVWNGIFDGRYRLEAIESILRSDSK